VKEFEYRAKSGAARRREKTRRSDSGARGANRSAEKEKRARNIDLRDWLLWGGGQGRTGIVLRKKKSKVEKMNPRVLEEAKKKGAAEPCKGVVGCLTGEWKRV